MTRALIVHSAGPGLTLQDHGRPGHLAQGLSRGGAADLLALAEGAALLEQDQGLAALEMAGLGGDFEATEDTRIALTGAPMRAAIDGTRIAWHASHPLSQGARLSIGPAEAGVFGYLHVGGGFSGPKSLGSCSTHLAAGLGERIRDGARIPIGAETGRATGLTLDIADRFRGGRVRMVPSLQTEVFPPGEQERFCSTAFRRDARGNRMGVPLVPPGTGFQGEAGLRILSEVIVPGDIQVTGDGTPFVLLCECQTTGGYPRIGSVLPADLPRVAQCPSGSSLTFEFVPLERAVEIERAETQRRARLKSERRPLVRDPRTMRDLLSYHLISGATAGPDAWEDST